MSPGRPPGCRVTSISSHVTPMADARAKRLCRRFFRRKPGRKTLRRILLPQAVSLLARRKNPVQKTIAKLRNHSPNPRNLRKVNPRSNQHLAWRLT